MQCSKVREQLSAYHAGELGVDVAASVRAHLELCEDCRGLLEKLRALDVMVGSLPTPRLERSSADRILASIHEATGTGAVPKGDVWTPEEVAEYLKVSPAEVYDMADHMPFFSFGSTLRIRKERLLAWIEEQERVARHGSPFVTAQGL